MMKRYYSAEETAEILGCAPKTILEMVRRGDLRGAKIGKAYRFRADDIDACYELYRDTHRGDPADYPALPELVGQ